MKFFGKNKAFTLTEILVSIVILMALMLGIFTFFNSAFIKLVYDNSKVKNFEEILEFRNDLGNYIDSGYRKYEIINFNSNNPNKALLLKHVDPTKGSLLVGVVKFEVGDDYGILQSEYLYGDNFLGITKLNYSQTQNINNINSIKFYNDSIYHNLRMKDFLPELYNNGNLVDIYISLTHIENLGLKSKDFSAIDEDVLQLQKYNLVY